MHSSHYDDSPDHRRDNKKSEISNQRWHKLSIGKIDSHYDWCLADVNKHSCLTERSLAPNPLG